MPNKPKQTFHFCPKCREFSIIRRNYLRKTDNRLERGEWCLNHGCGYRLLLPFRILTPQEVANA